MTPLAKTCIKPFTPAVLGPDGQIITPATAECRTSEITLAEFKTLTGKMDAFNPAAQTPAQFLGGTANFRTDYYAGPTSGHLMTFAESIELFKKLGVKQTPELKSPSVTMPFDGFTQEMYAQKIDRRAQGCRRASARRLPAVVRQGGHPVLGQPRARLRATGGVPRRCQHGGRLAHVRRPRWATGRKASGSGRRQPSRCSPSTASNRIVASQWARDAKAAGLDIITWTLERSGILADGNNGFYYQTIDQAITREGDLYEVIDALARDVGVLGMFSDWAAPVTFYANCMGK